MTSLACCPRVTLDRGGELRPLPQGPAAAPAAPTGLAPALEELMAADDLGEPRFHLQPARGSGRPGGTPARLLRYDALAIAFAHEPEEIAAAPGQVVDEADT